MRIGPFYQLQLTTLMAVPMILAGGRLQAHPLLCIGYESGVKMEPPMMSCITTPTESQDEEID